MSYIKFCRAGKLRYFFYGADKKRFFTFLVFRYTMASSIAVGANR